MLSPTGLAQVKDVAAIAAPITALVIETWLRPKLAAFGKRRAVDKQLAENLFVEKFADYLERSYTKHSYINTVVFPNQKKLLSDLYVPLTLTSTATKEKVRIDKYPRQLVEKQQVLVTDTAGMGKSTLLKVLFLKCVEENAGIPVFVELRRLGREVDLLDLVFEELNPLTDAFDRGFVLARLQRGDFVFFLDGYDEIGPDQREAVTRGLRSFQSKASKNTFVMSSRPEGALAAFPDFSEYRVAPLTKEEAFTLIRKYGQGQPLAEQLIERLSSTSLRNVSEFLGNPLLVSLLFKSYEHKPTVPFKKHAFYRQVYDALFESHDLAKEGAFTRKKACGLDSSDFHRVMRGLGFSTMKLGRVEYDKDEILSILRGVRALCPGITLREDSFLADLTSTVPLFIREGDSYRWAHKSIQEYFAAQFICEDAKARQHDLLLGLYRSDRYYQYHNVLDLCYDIDYKSFRRAILGEIAVDFLAYVDTAYRSFDGKRKPVGVVDDRRRLAYGRAAVVLNRPQEDALLGAQGAEDAVSRALGVNVDGLMDVSVYSVSPKGTRFMLDYQRREWAIFRLLAQKQSDLVDRPRRADHPKQLNLSWVRKTPLQLNEDPDSQLNSSRNFARTTQALAWRAPFAPRTEAWRQLRSELDAESEREGAADFLTSGL